MEDLPVLREQRGQGDLVVVRLEPRVRSRLSVPELRTSNLDKICLSFLKILATDSTRSNI